jgi:hypothetical protein
MEFKVIDKKEREAPGGKEVELVAERKQPDGTSVIIKQFYRKVDAGPFYVIFNCFNDPAIGPFTVIMTGQKGSVEGTQRRDVIDIVTVGQDGNIQRLAQHTTQVLLKLEEENLSPGETAQRFLTEKFPGILTDFK